LRNSIVTLEDKAGGVDINADRRTIEHLTREVQELMAYRVAHDKPETIVGDVFVGKGTGDAVPDYLHYDGYIRNKFYSKRDTERLIRIMAEIVVLGWIDTGAYNLCAALEQYQYDSECRIFQLILDGEIPEDARADQLRGTQRPYE
ncbi:hypothetical protein DYB28_014143, partial [Aphanomyces astaci]